MSHTKRSKSENTGVFDKVIEGSLGNARHVAQLNAECVKQAMESSERDSACYRRILESEDRTFEEKKAVHEWMVDEREERRRLSAEGQRGNASLGLGIPLLLIAIAGVGVASNPEISKLLLDKLERGIAALNPAETTRSIRQGASGVKAIWAA